MTQRTSPVIRGTWAGPGPPAAAMPWRLDGAATRADAPLVLALHGWSMHHDFFATLLQKLFDLPLRVLTPRAPLRASGIRSDGASWYDYDGNPEHFLRELRRTDALLLELLSHVEKERRLAPRVRIVLGFSQGGYTGAYTALRHPDRFAGLVVSGARVKTEVLAPSLPEAARRGFRVLLLHGSRDASVAPEAAQRSHDALAAAGVAVTLRTFDSGHSLGRAQVATIREWLEQNFLGN